MAVCCEIKTVISTFFSKKHPKEAGVWIESPVDERGQKGTETPVVANSDAVV